MLSFFIALTRLVPQVENRLTGMARKRSQICYKSAFHSLLVFETCFNQISLFIDIPFKK